MLKKIPSYSLSTISFFTSPHSYTSREILRRVDNLTMRDIHRFAKASTSMKADALIRDNKKKRSEAALRQTLRQRNTSLRFYIGNGNRK